MFFNLGPAELMVLLVIFTIMAVPVLLIVLLLAAVARRSQPGGPDPRAVLADRLARGEISQAEFDMAMRALGYTR